LKVGVQIATYLNACGLARFKHYITISTIFFIVYFLSKRIIPTKEAFSLRLTTAHRSKRTTKARNMATMERVFANYNAQKAILAKSKHPFACGVAWVAGELVPLHEAKIPFMDQGFLHSDLTYDVPSVWGGLFFRLDDHLERLSLSCTKIRLHLPLPKEEIKKVLLDMVSKNGIRDAFVELIVTRGFKGVRGSKPEDIKPNLYMFIMPYIWVQEPEMQLAGTRSAIIARTVRRIPPGSFDPTVKNLQ